jgi:hypothetical protein
MRVLTAAVILILAIGSYFCCCTVVLGKLEQRALSPDVVAYYALPIEFTVQVGSLHKLRLESLKLIFQPLKKKNVNKL